MNKETLQQMQDLLDKMKVECTGKIELEKGKWYIANYKSTDYEYLILLDDAKELDAKFYFCHGDLFNSGRFDSIIRFATPLEVKEALTKEAVKRGYNKPSLRWKSLSNPGAIVGSNTDCYTGEIDFSYHENSDTLCFGFGGIYKQGQWAEIIKDKEIMIGDHVAEFMSGAVQINYKTYTLSFWRDCSRISQLGASVTISGQTVPIETIQEIIKRLEN